MSLNMNRYNSNKPLAVALLQQQIDIAAKQNLQNLTDKIVKAAKQGAKLIVLPELHNHRYFCQNEDTNYFDLAETIPGPSTEHLANIARECSVVLVASLFEKRAPGLYHNSAVVFDADGSIAGIYRKMHIPDDPGYYEKFYFTPGDLGFNPIETAVGKLGILVCWDQWFPESARLMALAGAEMLILPTAIGWDRSDSVEEQKRQQEAWLTIQRAHAIANGIPLLSCNRVGFESNPKLQTDGILFWGSSFVCGPQGEIIAQASSDEAATITANIDMSRSEEVRRIWPFLRDRRIDSYQGLSKRYLD